MYTLYLLVYQTCIYNGKIYFIKKKTKEKFKNSFVRQSSTKMGRDIENIIVNIILKTTS